jgi:hypothetical protein
MIPTNCRRLAGIVNAADFASRLLTRAGYRAGHSRFERIERLNAVALSLDPLFLLKPKIAGTARNGEAI